MISEGTGKGATNEGQRQWRAGATETGLRGECGNRLNAEFFLFFSEAQIIFKSPGFIYSQG